MAREEQDREDLLREAVALVERIELQVAGEAEPVVAGYRRDGSLSFYFGADPVWQFNTRGELRRAFRAGKLLKAQQGRLIELTRERSAAATELVSRELSAAEQQPLLQEACERLAALGQALADGRYEIAGQVPAEVDLIAKLRTSLAALGAGFAVAAVPRVG